MIKLFYFSDKTGKFYGLIDEAIQAEQGRNLTLPENYQISFDTITPINEFELLRKEYMAQRKALQDKFEDGFVKLIKAIDAASAQAE